MKYQLISHLISENVYTQRDIHQQNIKRLTDYRASLKGAPLPPLEALVFKEDLREQNELLKTCLDKITKIEMEAFRYGL